jgi:hypothetical protein
MEDVLDTSERPYDSSCPVIGMDKQPVQLHKETRVSIAATAEPGQGVDYGYEHDDAPVCGR